jgi:hypothetical protein
MFLEEQQRTQHKFASMNERELARHITVPRLGIVGPHRHQWV